MSRKNNLKRRATQHDFDKRREAEALAKLEAKRLRKAAHAPVTQPEHMAVGDAGPASASAGAPPARQSPLGNRSRLQVAAGGVAKHKTKAKGFRIKKNVMVQGIKIKDSDSRKEAKRRLKALRAQQALELMQTD